MANDSRTDADFEPRRAAAPVGGAREVGGTAGTTLAGAPASPAPRSAGEGPVPAGRPPQREPERLPPKPLQRVLGFVILCSTVGLLSCQAFLD